MTYVAVKITGSVHREIRAVGPTAEAALALAGDDVPVSAWPVSIDLGRLIAAGVTPQRCTVDWGVADACYERSAP